jgi:glucosyl-dolichyl phosphate glucuronosyltransferase
MSRSLTIVLPTKDRPHALKLAVESVFSQTVLPNQLIVVDQSTADDSQRAVTSRYNTLEPAVRSSLKLVYIRDTSIAGLTAARNCSLRSVSEEVVLFLDDDVILEPDFAAEVLAVYDEHPNAVGVSGIVTNYSPPSPIFRWWSKLFTRGPFWDDRQPVYWSSDRIRNHGPVPVSRLGGGLMSFRMDAIRGKWFDENLRGAGYGEDVEFCSRLQPGALLLITPRARLVHNHNPVGRLSDHWLRPAARSSAYLYGKNWNSGVKNRLCALWLGVGFGVIATASSLRRRSLAPWRALQTGHREAEEALNALQENPTNHRLSSNPS